MIQLLEDINSSGILPTGTYLAGGTAVYLYMKHRISIDLDFFCADSFSSLLILDRLKGIFNPVHVEITETNTLIAYLTTEKIKFSLFHYPFPLLEEIVFLESDSGSVYNVASMSDIESMKAIAIAQRGSIKDFIDLYYIIKRTQHSLKDLFPAIRKKYGVEQNYFYHLKTAMVYFDDAEREFSDILMLDCDAQVSSLTVDQWDQVKNFFREFVL